VEPLGAETHLELSLDGQVIKAKAAGFLAPSSGEVLKFSIRTQDLCWFSKETGQAL
jgi:hypothetical protein